MSSRKLALWLALATAGVLVVMVIISFATGATQEAHEWYALPVDYADKLRAQAAPLRLIFGLDIAFLVLYTAFFAAFADHLRALGRPFVWLALGAMVATALLDIVEDHHILALLGLAEADHPIDDGAIAFQQVLSQTKFSISYLALFLFGVAVPADGKLAWVLKAFLTAGTLLTAVLGYAASPAGRQSLESTRWVGFLVGFALAIAWLRQTAEPTPSPAR